METSLTAPLPRVRTRRPINTAVLPVEADEADKNASNVAEEKAPVAVEARTRSRVRDMAAAPVATRTAAPATTSVVNERTFSDGRAPEVERNTQQFPVDIPTVHGTVNVGGKITIEPSPGTWVSMSIGLWFPCAPTEEEMQKTYLACSEWCERRLMREMAIAKGEYNQE